MNDRSVVWSAYAFEGELINVRVDTVRLPNGDLRQREVAEHPGAVAIVPVLDDGRVVLVRQFRPAIGRSILELPAGTVEPDEDAARTATRELAEETGCRASSLTELVRFFVSPGWCNEELVIFVATGITQGNQSLEVDEDISLAYVDAAEIPDLIRAGEIADAKTMVGLSLHLGMRL